MTKSELVDRVAAQTGVHPGTIDVVIGKTFKSLAEALAAGESVAIPGFGALSVRERPERAGRNPRTGEPLTIPASRVPVFKPAKALREALNEPLAGARGTP